MFVLELDDMVVIFRFVFVLVTVAFGNLFVLGSGGLFWGGVTVMIIFVC